jgi:anti-anti-sigma factor
MKYTIAEKDKIVIITISGDIENDAEARALTTEITRMTEKGKLHFCFNLSKATYLNSSGVSIFIHTLAETESRKGSICMVVSDPQVRSVAELSGLDKLMKTYATMADFEKENSRA